MITIWQAQQKALGATNFPEKFPRRRGARRVASRRIDEPGCPKKNRALRRHPRFTYRFNNRGSLYAAVFEWLIRCLQPSGRRTMLEVISQPFPCFRPLCFVFSFSLLGSRLTCPLLFAPNPSHTHPILVNVLHIVAYNCQSPSSRSISMIARSYARMYSYRFPLDVTPHNFDEAARLPLRF